MPYGACGTCVVGRRFFSDGPPAQIDAGSLGATLAGFSGQTDRAWVTSVRDNRSWNDGAADNLSVSVVAAR